MNGVRAVAYAAQAIERGNAHAGGEVSVGAAADRGFFELPSYMAGDGVSFLVERCHAGCSLHREAVDVARHLEFAVLVEWLEGAQLAVDGGCLFRALDAHIDAHRGFGGNHICARSATNHPRVY